MRTYSLTPVRYSIPKTYRYLESGLSDEYNERRAISQLKIKSFRIDWDKIQKEMGIEIPYDTKMLYQDAYEERSFSVAEMLEKVEGVGGLVGFAGTLITGLLKLFTLNHILFIAAISFIIILMVYRAVHSSSHKLKDLDPIVINRIADQMRTKGLNTKEVKHVWGESYREVTDGYISRPWKTFFINLLGMAAMSFIMSVGLSRIVNSY